AAGLPAAERDRLRERLASRAVRQGDRQGIVLKSLLLPPNNARLMAALVYVSHLDDFERLAPADADVRPAIHRLIEATPDAAHPSPATEPRAPPKGAPALRTARGRG